MDAEHRANPIVAAEIDAYEAMRLYRRTGVPDPRGIGRVLVEPLTALEAAWWFKRDGSVASEFAAAFAYALYTACTSGNQEEFADLGWNPLNAFPRYAATLNKLVQGWLEVRPDGNAWLEKHDDLYRQIQMAQASRSTTLVRPNRDTGPSPKPFTVRMFRGQSGYEQAAETAALAIWGDFLAGSPEEVGFCSNSVCSRPFPAKSNRKYCGSKCAKGTNGSSGRTHNGDTRARNFDRMRHSASNLRAWLQSSRRRGNWRTRVDPDTPRDRQSRWLTSFVRVALNQDGPGASVRLFDLCFDPRPSAPSKVQVRKEFVSFLANIRKAESLSGR